MISLGPLSPADTGVSPMLTVTPKERPSCWTFSASTRLRRFSARASARSRPHPGNRTANSSPPNRATVSDWRTALMADHVENPGYIPDFPPSDFRDRHLAFPGMTLIDLQAQIAQWPQQAVEEPECQGDQHNQYRQQCRTESVAHTVDRGEGIRLGPDRRHKPWHLGHLAIGSDGRHLLVRLIAKCTFKALHGTYNRALPGIRRHHNPTVSAISQYHPLPGDQAQIACIPHTNPGDIAHEVVTIEQNQPANHAGETSTVIKKWCSQHYAWPPLKSGNVRFADNRHELAGNGFEVWPFRGIEAGDQVIKRIAGQ